MNPNIISWETKTKGAKSAKGATANVQTAYWQSEAHNPVPKRTQVIDDTLSADAAYKLACEGTAMIWQGDFQNAKHLMQAISRRIDNRFTKPKAVKVASLSEQTPQAQFHLHRKNQIERARTLGMLLVELSADYVLPYNRAPDVKAACESAYGVQKNGTEKKSIVLSLRELLGVIGAYEWRKNGVDIEALNAKITPYYGVYSPLRGEYINLVATAPLPAHIKTAFDIGTGTGVLAAVLAQRGVAQIVATDNNARALKCATENITKLGFAKIVKVTEADLFPEVGKADLIVCNPPWIPASANSPIEHAIYDPSSHMLKGFLKDLSGHLNPKGEGWLIMSDIAEHFGLRTREELLAMFKSAGLSVIDRLEIKPTHPKVVDQADALHEARRKEVTSLWRLEANV